MFWGMILTPHFPSKNNIYFPLQMSFSSDLCYYLPTFMVKSRAMLEVCLNPPTLFFFIFSLFGQSIQLPSSFSLVFIEIIDNLEHMFFFFIAFLFRLFYNSINKYEFYDGSVPFSSSPFSFHQKGMQRQIPLPVSFL